MRRREYATRGVYDRFIASEITRLRERAGHSGEWLARKMGWSASKMSRVEHGRSPISLTDLPRLLDTVGATEAERAAIMNAADGAAAKDPYRNAAGVLAWGPTSIPLAAATLDYGWTVESAAAGQVTRLSPLDTQKAADSGTHWQTLARDSGEFTIDVLADESCLTRRYGSAKVMEEQAAHLLSLMDRPNLTIQIVPAGATDLPSVEPFTYIKFSPGARGPAAADTVLLPQLGGARPLHSTDETYLYHVAFHQLRQHAYEPAETRRVVENARRYWGDLTGSPTGLVTD